MVQQYFCYLFSLFLFLFVWFNANGQHTEDFHFRHLTPEDGLSQSTIYTMLQDSEGFMWFATQDGLNRYDGYEMTVYGHKPDDPGSISYNRTFRLYEDKRDNLWVGTLGRGLNLFDRDLNRFERFSVDPENSEPGYYGNSVIDMFEDSRGNFWVGKTNGLYLKDRDTQELVQFTSEPDNPHSLSDNSVTAIFEDSNQNFWVGTQNGLNRMDREKESFTRFTAEPSDPRALNHPYVYTIYEDSRQNLWIGTRGGGLHRYDEETGDFQRYIHSPDNPYSIGGNSVTSIVEDNEGRLWIGTENNGLNFFDRDNERFYQYKSDRNNPSSLSSNSILSLYISDQNLLWVGTFDGGVNITTLDSPPFEHFKPEFDRSRSLSHPAVLSFGEDHQGNIWIGTDGGGVNRLDKQTNDFSTLRHNPVNSNSLSSDIILEIYEDHRQKLWMGTYQGGITIYDADDNAYDHYQHDPDDPTSLSNNEVWSIYRDQEGTLWVGTCSGGLNRFDEDTKTFVRYMRDPDDPTSLLNNFISTIYEDSQGRFWIGTYGGGLNRMNRDTGTFTPYTMSNSDISDNVVVTLHEDTNGHLWIGTKGGGLNRFNVENEEFTSYTTSDGLPNNVIHGIQEDENNFLWLSTNNGISKFNPENESFTNYHLSHGLQSGEFKEGSYFTDSDGFMYFGGINGFNRFHPDSIHQNKHVPPAIITDFKISNKSVTVEIDSPLDKHISQTEKIVLPYTASVISFHYVALNFAAKKGIRYAYKMDGFDNDWNYVGEQRMATYTNLDAGEYRFRVKASNSDGVWDESDTSLALVITPPFWRTSWFYLLSVLFIIAVTFTAYRLRVRSIREQNNQLEQKVASRTADLKEALEELKSTRDELVEKAHKAGMADIATGVLHNVGNILNSVNTSASLIGETVRQSRVAGLVEANVILRNHIDRIEEFITENSKGKKLMQYYLRLEEPLKSEHSKLLNQSDRLIEKIKLINEVIAAQQSYAGANMYADPTSLTEMIDNALALQAGSIEKHGLTIEKELQNIDPIVAQRTKLIHVLVNIFKNAKEAMACNPPRKKKISIKVWQDDDWVYLSVSDNGSGISREHLDRIFTHGFTTKANGHGFGLHSSANYMTEMGGKIEVNSEGKEKGATITLMFPKQQPTNNKSANDKEHGIQSMNK